MLQAFAGVLSCVFLLSWFNKAVMAGLVPGLLDGQDEGIN